MRSPLRLPRDAGGCIRLLLALEASTLAAYAVLLSVPQIPVSGSVRDVWVGNLVYVWPILVLLVRGWAHPRDRGWSWSFAAAVTCFLGANLLYVLWVDTVPAPPFPSWADAAYLSTYPFYAIGVVLSMRARIGRLRGSVLLDGLTAGLAAATVGGLCVLPLAHAFEGGTLQIVVAAAYPVADVALVSMVLGVFAATGGRPGRFYACVAAGLVVFALADVVYAYRIALDSYTVGTPLDLTWALGVATIAFAVSRAPGQHGPAPSVGVSSLWVTGVSSLAVTAVLAVSSRVQLPLVVVLLATTTLLVSAARTVIAFRRVQDMAAIRRQAMTDELTGLPNRRALYQHIEQALAQRRPGRLVGVAMLDLDRFKEVNDSLGHQAGDLLLRSVSARLGDALDLHVPGAVLARLGGDEYAVLLPDVADLDSLVRAAEHLEEALTEPVQLEDSVLVHVRASTGLAAAPEHGETRVDMLRCADMAMYAAKRGGTGARLFRAEQSAANGDRLQLAEDLRRAITSDQLRVHYQPKVDLAGSGRAVEALVRWAHPDRGLLAPDAFLPLAEDHRLMPALTRIVLGIALADCAAIRRAGIDLAVSVNLSAADLLDETLPGFVQATLAEHGVPDEALTLEITETTVMSDPLRAQTTLERLHEQGVRLSVDDYGTGHCSLAYLRRLPVQELKLDRSFVTHMSTEPRDSAIVRSSVDLAHSLGLRMVAEGVEDAGAVDLLIAAGCDVAQGFYFARPMPVDELLSWLEARPVGLRDEPASPPAAAVLGGPGAEHSGRVGWRSGSAVGYPHLVVGQPDGGRL